MINKLTKSELKKLCKCNGIHATIDDLFKCDSCSILFNVKGV